MRTIAVMFGCVVMACGPGSGPGVECMPIGGAQIIATGTVTSDCAADIGELTLIVAAVDGCDEGGRCSALTISAADATGVGATHTCAVQGDPLACSGSVRLTCDPFGGSGAERPAEVFRGTLTVTVELYEGDPGEAAGTITIDGGGCLATLDASADVYGP